MVKYQYGAIISSVPLPPGVSTQSIKQVSEKYYGNLIRSSDSPNNYQKFHSIEVVTDTANVPNCIPALGSDDGNGYILSEYDSAPMKGELAKVTLTYSILTAYTPDATSNEQSSTRQVSITQWAGFSDPVLGGGNGTTTLNGAIYEAEGWANSQSIAQGVANNLTGSWSFGGAAGYGGTIPTDLAGTSSYPYFTSQSVFKQWAPSSPYVGNDTFEVASISYTYTEYSNSEFSSDADLLGTIQTPIGAPALSGSGNWLLNGSNRGKSGYFYTKNDTYVGSVPPWNTVIFAAS